MPSPLVQAAQCDLPSEVNLAILLRRQRAYLLGAKESVPDWRDDGESAKDDSQDDEPERDNNDSLKDDGAQSFHDHQDANGNVQNPDWQEYKQRKAMTADCGSNGEVAGNHVEAPKAVEDQERAHKTLAIPLGVGEAIIPLSKRKRTSDEADTPPFSEAKKAKSSDNRQGRNRSPPSTPVARAPQVVRFDTTPSVIPFSPLTSEAQYMDSSFDIAADDQAPDEITLTASDEEVHVSERAEVRKVCGPRNGDYNKSYENKHLSDEDDDDGNIDHLQDLTSAFYDDMPTHGKREGIPWLARPNHKGKEQSQTLRPTSSGIIEKDTPSNVQQRQCQNQTSRKHHASQQYDFAEPLETLLEVGPDSGEFDDSHDTDLLGSDEDSSLDPEEDTVGESRGIFTRRLGTRRKPSHKSRSSLNIGSLRSEWLASSGCANCGKNPDNQQAHRVPDGSGGMMCNACGCRWRRFVTKYDKEGLAAPTWDEFVRLDKKKARGIQRLKQISTSRETDEKSESSDDPVDEFSEDYYLPAESSNKASPEHAEEDSFEELAGQSQSSRSPLWSTPSSRRASRLSHLRDLSESPLPASLPPPRRQLRRVPESPE